MTSEVVQISLLQMPIINISNYWRSLHWYLSRDSAFCLINSATSATDYWSHKCTCKSTITCQIVSLSGGESLILMLSRAWIIKLVRETAKMLLDQIKTPPHEKTIRCHCSHKCMKMQTDVSCPVANPFDEQTSSVSILGQNRTNILGWQSWCGIFVVEDPDLFSKDCNNVIFWGGLKSRCC